MTKKPNKDEALKADESQNEEESPTSESEGLELTGEPIDKSLRPEEPEGEEAETESTEEEEAEGAPEEESEAPKEGRKTAQSRIRDLNAKKKAAEEKAESLEEQVKRLTSFKPQEDFVPQSQFDEAQDESNITVEELMRRQDALVQIRFAQQDNIHRVQSEAAEAIKAYPELDPDSDSFDSELSEAVSQATLAKIQSDPTSSVKNFVDSLIKPYRRSLEKQEAGQKETITKQVSEQAMRPTQVQEQERPFSELSIKEMEKKLGTVYR